MHFKPNSLMTCLYLKNNLSAVISKMKIYRWLSYLQILCTVLYEKIKRKIKWVKRSETQLGNIDEVDYCTGLK